MKATFIIIHISFLQTSSMHTKRLFRANWTFGIRIFLILLIRSSLGQINKAKYYEKLIENGVKNADSYKQRTDNTDLLGEAKCNKLTDFGKFDFIIVGAGTTGSILARRLTEIRNWNILLLEAGGMNDDLSDIPYLKGLTHLSTKNWGFLSASQKNACTANVDNRCPIIRGKLLGGTSALDDVFYSRGSRTDLDNVLGILGWSYNDLLPYFKKVENFTINRNSRNHGFKGLINIANIRPMDISEQQLATVFEQFGIRRNIDYNGGNQTGTGRVQARIKNGERCSSANYINTLYDRSNLNLTLNAFVTKILIDSNKTAYGVQFVINGTTYIASTSKEIIVSAGSINTPQLLKLSGIGPLEELRSHGIRLIKNLPVGLRLNMKLRFSMYFKSNSSVPTQNLTSLVKEFLEGKGLFTTDRNNRLVSYVHDSGNTSSIPNLAIVFAPPTGPVDVDRDYSTYKAEVRESFRSEVNSSNNFIISILLLRPYSENGSITLNSSSPVNFPNINLNMFADMRDLRTIFNGIRLILNITRSINARAIIPFCGCDNFQFGSKDYWYCALRALAVPFIQIASTVKMGPRSDPYSVVDHKLKVYGMRNLRVVDYAVVPSETTAQSTTLAFAIAERAGDFIKHEYGNK